MPQDLGRLLTVADVADVLNISIAEVSGLIRGGELPAIQLGSGLWRIERDVLRGYIDGKYEETRRAALWHQAELQDLPELQRRSLASQLKPRNR